MVRSKLVGIDLKRAEHHCGIAFRSKNIFIIGDSPHDVECGKANSVNSIAVATGHCGEDDLKRFQPDYTFRDLGDHDNVLQIIAGE